MICWWTAAKKGGWDSGAEEVAVLYGGLAGGWVQGESYCWGVGKLQGREVCVG
jgi:hypothetical protein